MSEHVTLPYKKAAELSLPSYHADHSDDNENTIGINFVILFGEGFNNTWYLTSCIEKHSNNNNNGVMDGVQLPQGYRATTRAVYFLPLSP